MNSKKTLVRQDRVVGESKRFAFVGSEALDHIRLRNGGLQALRNSETKPAVKSDQATIESRIVQSRQAESVADVQSLRFIPTPRHNMRSDQQLTNTEPSHTTTSSEIIQDGLPEIFLTTANIHRGPSFRRSQWNLAHSHTFLWSYFNLQVFVRVKERSERGFTRWRSLREIVVKLPPRCPVERARAGQPFDPA